MTIYYFARILCRLAFPFFIKKRLVEGLENIPADRPVLLASNHPDSFFDAVVIGVHLNRPIYTLTRADVFRKPAAAKWLRGINLIPVFRASEGGREYLSNNDKTFEECKQVFRQNGIVVIFAEGICLNQTELLPLKKGAMRLAQQAWEDPEIGEKLVIVPTGLWYSSYQDIGKNIALRFAKPISRGEFSPQALTAQLTVQLLPLVTAPARFSGRSWGVEIGQLLHWPVYAAAQHYVSKLTKGTVFYDSVLFGVLMVALPLYWILLVAILLLCC
jgi:1-acyl-sn-glycerol-3-phosphate acyltransferase